MNAATRKAREVPLIDPTSGRPLRADRPWSLTDGETRWPVVAGIPYLRPGRDALRLAALARLDAGDDRGALVLLLADQDDHARIPPPEAPALGLLIDAVEDGSATLRDAMASLRFGPVADYFAYRWSSPTYLSGLALLDRHGPHGSTIVEVACGIGHYLRDLARRGRPCLGVDVVFAKLWLARRFVVPPEVGLACGDASLGLPIGPPAGSGAVFCQDAFYFLADKPKVIEGFRRVVGESGAILIGHAHNGASDHGGVSGEPKTPAEYAELLPGALLYDDAELARLAWSNSLAPPRSPDDLAGVEAVALAWPGLREVGPGFTRPIPGGRLQLNPLLVDEGGTLRPAWPSSRFEAEYAAQSPYLLGEAMPSPETLERAARGGLDPEIERLAIRRILLDLPGRW